MKIGEKFLPAPGIGGEMYPEISPKLFTLLN